MEYTKENRPKGFDKLLPELQNWRKSLEMQTEISKMKEEEFKRNGYPHHNPTWREIKEDKIRNNHTLELNN